MQRLAWTGPSTVLQNITFAKHRDLHPYHYAVETNLNTASPPKSASRILAGLSAIICVVAFLFAGRVFAQDIRLDAAAMQRGEIPLAGHLWAFHDASGALTVEQIASPEYAARFERLPGEFNGGFAEGAWWLRVGIDVMPDAASDWWLNLNAPYTDRLEVWAPRADGVSVWQYHPLGLLGPVSSREFLAPTFAARLETLPEGSATVWLRLSGRHPLSLQGAFWPKRPLMQRLIWSTGSWMAGLMLVALLAMVSLAIGAAQRDGYFLAFAIHLGATALSVSIGGLLPRLSPEHVGAVSLLRDLLPCVGVITGTFLAYTVLEVRAGFPHIAVVLRLVMVVGLLLMVPAALGHVSFAVSTARVLTLLMNVLFLVLAVVRVRRGVPLAVWPLIAYGAGGGGAILYTVYILGLWNSGAWVLDLVKVTPAIFAVAIVIGLGQRTLRAEREARAAQARSLADSRAANDKLDATVAQRTRELRIENLERRRAEHRLKRALREQRNFLSTVSHEFRTPLSIIDASAQLVSIDHAAVDGRARRELEKVRRAARRMVDLVDSLLTDDWLDASAAQLHRADFDLVALLEAVRERHALASERRVELRTSDASLPIFADESLLGILLNNLLDNAVKHSPEGTAIEIDVRRDDGSVVVGVRDHGLGLHNDDIERIFERYYRAPSALKTPGLGLGLHIVHRIAELHEGSIAVANAPGGGARFELRLPVSEPQRPETLRNKISSGSE